MNAEILARLEALRSQPKFVDEPGTIYNGMRPEDTRRLAETQLNDLIDRLMLAPGDTPERKFVMKLFSQILRHFPRYYETEDRERMARYIVQLAEILGIKGYHGLLTRWLYGRILGTLLLLQTRHQRAT